MADYKVILENGKLIFKCDNKAIGIIDTAKLNNGVIYNPITKEWKPIQKLVAIRGDEEKQFETNNVQDLTEFLKFVYTKDNKPMKFYSQYSDAPENFMGYFTDENKRKILKVNVENKNYITSYAPYIYFNPTTKSEELFIPDISKNFILNHDDEQIVADLNEILNKIRTKLSRISKIGRDDLEKELRTVLSLAKTDEGLAKLLLIWSWTISSYYVLVLFDLGGGLRAFLIIVGEKGTGKSTVIRSFIMNSLGVDYGENSLSYGQRDLDGTGIRTKNLGMSTFPFIFDDITSLENFTKTIKAGATARNYVEKRGRPDKKTTNYLFSSSFGITTNKIDVLEPASFDRTITIPFSAQGIEFKVMSDDEIALIKNNNVLSHIFWHDVPNILKNKKINELKEMIKVDASHRIKDKLQYIKFGFEILRQILPTWNVTIDYAKMWNIIKEMVEHPSRDYIVEGETDRILTALVSYFTKTVPFPSDKIIENINKLSNAGSLTEPSMGITLKELKEKGVLVGFEEESGKIITKKLLFYGKIFQTGLVENRSGNITGLREVANAFKEQGLDCLYTNNYNKEADQPTSNYHTIEKGKLSDIQRNYNCIEVKFIDFLNWIEGIKKP